MPPSSRGVVFPRAERVSRALTPTSRTACTEVPPSAGTAIPGISSKSPVHDGSGRLPSTSARSAPAFAVTSSASPPPSRRLRRHRPASGAPSPDTATCVGCPARPARSCALFTRTRSWPRAARRLLPSNTIRKHDRRTPTTPFRLPSSPCGAAVGLAGAHVECPTCRPRERVARWTVHSRGFVGSGALIANASFRDARRHLPPRWLATEALPQPDSARTPHVARRQGLTTGVAVRTPGAGLRARE